MHIPFSGTFARWRSRYLDDFAFVHINKTGGSSIESALKLPFQHLTAVEMRDDLGATRWERRFTFAFVRNPWDKVASHYHYRVKTNQTGLGDGHMPFRDWVRAAYEDHDPRYHDKPRMFMPQVNWISDENGSIIVDYIGRFERLAADFDEVCHRIGRQASLPHQKSSSNRDFRREYDGETAEIIARCFAADIDAFGYSLE